jgi:hypothetical protein
MLLLQHSYVFGYYIDDQDPSMKRQKELFEHHQENLEKFTEKLRYVAYSSYAQHIDIHNVAYMHAYRQLQTQLCA